MSKPKRLAWHDMAEELLLAGAGPAKIAKVLRETNPEWAVTPNQVSKFKQRLERHGQVFKTTRATPFKGRFHEQLEEANREQLAKIRKALKATWDHAKHFDRIKDGMFSEGIRGAVLHMNCELSAGLVESDESLILKLEE